MADINGRFVVTYLRNVQHAVRVYDRAGRLVRELSIPPMTVVTDLRSGARDNELIVEARTGFAPTRTGHDISTGSASYLTGRIRRSWSATVRRAR